ncbi:YDG domain-containing protein [Sphingomonas sp. MMS24-J13]|uniref:YDG domain-containing protein n=1 Tax=Sphingomonas sp. MMS24-J13 TaxID=3238686 RepID=UPI00384F0097
MLALVAGLGLSVSAATPLRAQTAALQLPTGGKFAAGSGSISQSGAGMQVNQSTTRAIINWNSFSIGSAAAVTINNGAGATLNRVTGGVSSELLGTLSATGSVYLINPSGILIGKDAKVNVGGSFLASTLALTDDSFMTGGSFLFSGNSSAQIVNLGTISAQGGDVFLIARQVTNQGAIAAAQGTVGLATGSSVLLKDSGSDQRVYVQIGGGDLTNSGTISAAQAELRSADGNIYALAGNDGGAISATGTEYRDGHIWLTSETGSIKAEATLTARGTGGAGGQIETSAQSLDLGRAKIDAGVGGTWTLDPDSLTIDAALAGTIQTSLAVGSNVLQLTRVTGTGGTGDLTVASNIAWNTGANLTLSAYRDIIVGNGVTIANGSTGHVVAGSLNLLADNSGTGTGTVVFQGSGIVDFRNSSGIVRIGYNPLDGASHATVNATRYTSSVGYTGGSAGYTAQVLAGSNGATLSASMLVNSLTDLQNVHNDLSGNYLLGALVLDASTSATLDGGAGFTPIGSAATPFTGTFHGGGRAIDQLTINRPLADNVGLFGNLGATAVVDNLSLTNASITGGNFVGGIAGRSRGTISGGLVSGTVAGAFFVGGVVGSLDTAAASITNLIGAVDVTATNFVGGIAGSSDGTISGTQQSGAIAGDSFVGGIAGQSYGSLSAVTNTGIITGDAASVSLGGIVGVNTGSLTKASSSGAVSGSYAIGGLAGENDGTITLSNATATVTGAAIGNSAGGLVGLNANGATISQSFSNGITTSAASFTSIGGLVGENDGTISLSYSANAVQAGSDNVKIGGLAGSNLGQISQSYNMATIATGSGAARAGGVAGDNSGTITAAFSTAAMTPGSGATLVGGLVGTNSGTVSTSSFWDKAASGQANGTGGGTAIAAGQGLTTAQAQDKATLATLGFNAADTTFAILDGKSYPYLLWRYPTAPQVIAGTAFRDSAGTLASAGSAVGIAVNGNLQLHGLTSQSGYYYFLLDSGTIAAGSQIFAELVGNTVKANAAETLTGGTATGLNLLANTVTLVGNGGTTALSQLATAAGSLSGADLLYSTTGTSVTLGAGRSLAITGGTSAIEFDRSVITSGTGTIAASTAGAIKIDSGITLSSAASGNAITLSTGTSFVNQGGVSALSAAGGRWLVYSANPAADNAGGLTPGFLQYAAAPGTTPAASGNAFLYALAPVVTIGLTGTVEKTYDTSDSATLTGANLSISGQVNSDTVTPAITGTTRYDSKTAADTKTVTASGLQITVTHGALPVYGYQLASTMASATIGKIDQATLTAGLTGSVVKIYDSTKTATLTADNYTLGGVIGTDTVTLNDPASGLYDTKNAGSGKTVSVAGLALGGTDAANYRLAASSLSAKIGQIDTRTLVATLIGSATKTYDGTKTATLSAGNYNLAGVLADDTVAIVNTTGTYDTRDAGSGKTVTIAQVVLGGADASNYHMAPDFLSISGKIGQIDQATLTAGLTGTVTKTYDTTKTATLAAGNYTLGGVIGTDTVTLNDPTNGLYDTKNAGSGKTVSVSGLALGGTDAANYKLASDTLSAKVGQIDQATLTAGLSGTVTKTYDGSKTATLATGNYTLGGVIGTDAVTLNDPASGLYDTKNAGSGKTISVAGLALGGTDAGNYKLASDTLSAMIGRIDQATLAASLTGTVTKTYDTTKTATLTAANYTLGGVIGTDAVTVTTTAGLYDTKNAGSSKTVSVADLTLGGTDASNYKLASTSVSAMIGQIDQATLTAGLAGSVTKTYDGNKTATLTAGNYTLGGVIGTDTVSLNDPASGLYDSKNAGTGKTVSVAGLALNGTDAANYKLASDTLSAMIGKIDQATLTPGLTGTVTKTYDGTKTATLAADNYTLGGVIGGDAVAITATGGLYLTKTAGSGKTVTVTDLAIGGADAANYKLSTISLSATIGRIDQATLTAGLTGTVTKAYDASKTATLAAGNYTLGGVIGTDAVTLNDPTNGLYDSKNAGTGKTVSVSGLALNGTDAANYKLASDTLSAKIGQIDQATLTAALTGTVTKTYDGSKTATLAAGNYTLGGVIGEDAVTLNDPTAGLYDTKNAGTGKTVSVAGLALNGTDAANYKLASDTLSAKIGQIDQATLTAALTGSVTKTYDGGKAATLTAGNYTLGGVIGTDAVAVTTTAGLYDTKNAGSGKTVSVSDIALGGADAANYKLASTSLSAKVGQIDQATLTAGLTGTVTKTYDGGKTASLAAGNYTLGGVIGTDAVALNDPASGLYDTKNAGSGKTVSVAGLALGGTDAGNYKLASTSLSAMVGQIDQATLTAGLTGTVTKTYDTTRTATLAAGNYTLGGVIGTDAVTITTTAGLYDTKDAGTGKTVSVTNLMLGGGDAGNYKLAATSLSAKIGQIDQATLTAGLTGTVDKTYDGTKTATLAAGNYTLAGVLGTDVVALSDPAAGLYDSKDAGTGKAVSVAGLALNGGDAANYKLASSSLSAAIGQIDQATLTAGLTGTIGKTYDGTTAAALAAGNYTLAGVVGTDTVTLNDPAAGLYDTKNAGTGKTVSVTGLALGGSDAANYKLTATSLSAAIGTIGQVTLTAGLTGAVTKTYDGTTAATLAAGNYALTGAIASDTVAIATTAGSYDSKNAGTGKTVSVTGLTLSGADAANYQLASTSASAKIGTINQATLTAGLTGTVGKTYDGTTTATLAAGNYTLAGAIAGDTITVAGTSASYDSKNAGSGKTVSATGLALGGADAANYQLGATTASAKIGTIDQALLTVGLTGMVTKTYDSTTVATLAAGNYTIGGAVAGDTVNVATTTGSYDTKDAGSGKTVSVAALALGGADAANYKLASSSVSAAIGLINRAALTVTVNDASRLPNTGNPAFTVRYSGFAGTDGATSLGGTLAYATTATQLSPPGTYGVTASGQTSINYTIAYVPGTLTILPTTQQNSQDSSTPINFVTNFIYNNPDPAYRTEPDTGPSYVSGGAPADRTPKAGGDWSSAPTGASQGTDLDASGPAPLAAPQR